MRTITSPELALITSTAHVNHWLKVETKNASGTWKTLTSLGGKDWVDEVEWDGEAIDRPVATATIKLRRDAAALSLSPLMAASTLNVDDGGSYAPLLDVGRAVRISTAVTAHTVAPVTGDWKEMFLGRIDDIDWGLPTITVSASDSGAWVVDRFIEHSDTYGSDSGMAVELVLQSLLDAYPPNGAVTLYTPVSAGWVTTPSYKQAKKSLMEALNDLAAQIGWDIRYRYDASDVSRLTFMQPPRGKTTADFTLGPSTYRDIRKLAIAIADIRNAVVVGYTDSGTGQQTAVTSEDGSSIATYGRRYMEIDEDASSNIDTAVEAAAMATAARDDLKSPPAEQEVETNYFWPVQLYDLGAFTANGDHYDSDLKLAVVGVRHRFAAGEGVTTLQCRGSVAGAYQAWLRRGGVAISTEACALQNVVRTDSDDGTEATFSWTPSRTCAEVWAAYRVVTAPQVDADWAAVRLAVSPLGDGVTSFTVPRPLDNEVTLLQLEPRTVDLTVGTLRRITITANPQVPVWEFDDTETADTVTQWWRLTERGIAIVNVAVQTQVGTNPVSDFLAPTRGPGGASTVRGGTLGVGEYEQDSPRDAQRSTYIGPRCTLENGQIINAPPLQFDRDKNPNILSVELDTYTLKILCDAGDTKSISVVEQCPAWSATVAYVVGNRVTLLGVVYRCILGHTNHTPPNGTYWAVSAAWRSDTDAVYASVDLTATDANGTAGLGASTATFAITAWQQPTAYVVVGSTPSDTRNKIVSGPGSSSPSATWDVPHLAAYAPSLGNDTVILTLKATGTVIGYTAKVYIKESEFTTSVTPTVDETSNLSPALTTPPTVDTDYSWTSDFPASSGGIGSKLVTWKARCDLIVGGAVVDSQLVSASWYTGGA